MSNGSSMNSSSALFMRRDYQIILVLKLWTLDMCSVSGACCVCSKVSVANHTPTLKLEHLKLYMLIYSCCQNYH